MTAPIPEWVRDGIATVTTTVPAEPVTGHYPYRHAAALLAEYPQPFAPQHRGRHQQRPRPPRSVEAAERWLLTELGTVAGGPTHAAAAVALADAYAQLRGWVQTEQTRARRDRVLAEAAALVPYQVGDTVWRRFVTGAQTLAEVSACADHGDGTFTVTLLYGIGGPRMEMDAVVNRDGVGDDVAPAMSRHRPA